VRSLVHRQSGSGQVIDHAVESLGKRLSIAFLVREVLFVPNVVASSNLIAVVPARRARGFAGQLPMRIHSLPLRAAGGEHRSLYWHERTNDNPAHEWFCGVMTKIVSRFDAAKLNLVWVSAEGWSQPEPTAPLLDCFTLLIGHPGVT
jgi:DNA-binding transcriptional LysR family regulator